MAVDVKDHIDALEMSSRDTLCKKAAELDTVLIKWLNAEHVMVALIDHSTKRRWR